MMKKVVLIISLTLFLFVVVIVTYDNLLFTNESEAEFIDNNWKTLTKEQRIREAIKHEFDRTVDPELGRVPYERLALAEQYYSKRFSGKTNTAFSNINWLQRGPNNVGGRTRAILFLDEKRVLAAGVTGGLWRTNDITQNPPIWTPIGDFLSHAINISCLAQDPTDSAVLYAGTGEAFGSIHRGSGVYKSTNYGQTWTKLNATVNNNNFTYIGRILVNQDGHLYIAAKSHFCNRGGLFKSTNGGTTLLRVVGTVSGSCATSEDLSGADIEENDDGDLFYASGGNNGRIWFSSKSTHGSNVGNSGNWTNITPFGRWQRIEIGVSKRVNSGVIYTACQDSIGNDVQGIFYSTDKGQNWTARTVPTICDQGNNSVYTRNQAWYDLVVEIDPQNDSIAYFGGVDLMKTTDAGDNFTQISTWSLFWPSSDCSGSAPPYLHADHHALVFNPFVTNAAISSHDGGINYSTNMNNAIPTWTDKNSGYITTQFYAITTHPTNENYIIGGTQDNGSLRINNINTASASSVSGGDGGFCHINQKDPTYQTTSYVYNYYYHSSNSGSTFVTQNSSNNINTGRFINPTDLDTVHSILFSAGNVNVLEYRTGTNTSTLTRNTVTLGFNNRRLTALKVSPNNDSILYVGDDVGRVYKIANRGGTPTKTFEWTVNASGGYVSSIDVWKNSSNTDDSILVTLSSYGVNSVYVTGNGSTAAPTWINIDDNNTLQDMPVRWGIFSTEGPSKIFIATDLGVLGCDTLNGGSTQWVMVNNNVLPKVRVDMLKYNSAGNIVAGTHGRGIWESQTPCLLTNDLPTAAGVYQSKFSQNNGDYTCYCDEDGYLLLALDTLGTGTIVPKDSVFLEIGTTATTSWNTSGGIITNTHGGAIFNRKWHVGATAQPATGFTVDVRYFFTAAEYSAIVTALDNLTSSTTISNPNELQMYKMTNGGRFADPHATGATGIVMTHNSSFSTSLWTLGTKGTDYYGEFSVSSFSGGGGGGGGGNSALPVTWLNFDVSSLPKRVAQLDWSTSLEVENEKYLIYRSYDGENFHYIGAQKGNGTTNSISKYQYFDKNISPNARDVYYKIKQIDYDGKYEYSEIRTVRFDDDVVNVFPNPASNVLNIQVNASSFFVKVYNLNGQMVWNAKDSKVISVEDFPSGVYFLEVNFDGKRKILKFAKN
jgi:hypothetical protein